MEEEKRKHSRHFKSSYTPRKKNETAAFVLVFLFFFLSLFFRRQYYLYLFGSTVYGCEGVSFRGQFQIAVHSSVGM